MPYLFIINQLKLQAKFNRKISIKSHYCKHFFVYLHRKNYQICNQNLENKNMKIVSRILLVVAICVMGYLCVISITTPIEFEKAQVQREKAIIAKLIDIRQAQLEYQKLNGKFCPSADTLVNFILEGKLPLVLKEGTLTDDQLNNGLTEEKAVAIVNRGNKREIAANGLEGFRRDTTFVSVYESLYETKYSREGIADMMVIPYSENIVFNFDTASYTNPVTESVTPLFEVSADYDSYLSDLDRQQLINLKETQEKLERFLGLKVGSVAEPNNNAGNWE